MSTQRFIYQRVVRDGHVKVAPNIYRLDFPIPDGTPVTVMFRGNVQEGRSLGDCVVYRARYPRDGLGADAKWRPEWPNTVQGISVPAVTRPKEIGK